MSLNVSKKKPYLVQREKSLCGTTHLNSLNYLNACAEKGQLSEAFQKAHFPF